jgi:hypothetical protein
MGWSLGWDSNWKRDIGYGVPAICDLPTCNKKIDRGLAFVCGSEPYGGDYGCGLYFCPEHFNYRKPHGSNKIIQLCPRCIKYKNSYGRKPDTKEWVEFKLNDDSWKRWKSKNKDEVETLKYLCKRNLLL